jgi:hypothetical protein
LNVVSCGLFVSLICSLIALTIEVLSVVVNDDKSPISISCSLISAERSFSLLQFCLNRLYRPNWPLLYLSRPRAVSEVQKFGVVTSSKSLQTMIQMIPTQKKEEQQASSKRPQTMMSPTQKTEEQQLSPP